MFYAQFVLSKKGPLAKIWLAAHWEKKLSKAQIYETNVQDAVDEIIKPKSKMPLRTTGHLLLGIVRIYSRKARYLLLDCTEASFKIKTAFRPGTAANFEQTGDLDAPQMHMPDVFMDYEASLPDFNDVDLQHQLHINQSRIDDITLKEDLNADPNMGSDFMMDDFGESSLAPGTTFDFDSGFSMMAPGEELEEGRDMSRSTNLARDLTSGTTRLDAKDSFAGFDDDAFEGAGDLDDIEDLFTGTTDFGVLPTAPTPMPDMDEPAHLRNCDAASEAGTEFSVQIEPGMISVESRRVGRPRKRRLIYDDPPNITGEEMKSQMSNYADTLQPLDLAPPTKRLMKLRECGNVEKLFHLPGSEVIRAKPLIRNYHSRLNMHHQIEEDTTDLRRELEMLDTIDDGDIPSTMPPEDDFDYGAFEEVFDEPIVDAIPLATDEPDTNFEEKKEEKEEKQKKDKKSKQVEIEDDIAEGDEDNRFNKRTQNVLHSISTKLQGSKDSQIQLSDLLTKASNKKTAAQKFYTLLVLKKWQAIEVQQAQPFTDIMITAGPNIEQTVSH